MQKTLQCLCLEVFRDKTQVINLLSCYYQASQSVYEMNNNNLLNNLSNHNNLSLKGNNFKLLSTQIDNTLGMQTKYSYYNFCSISEPIMSNE